MPSKLDQEKVAKYKNRLVCENLKKYPILKEVIEQLPDDLKGLWSQGKYKKFLENALNKLELLQILPVICPTFRLSDEREVSKLLQDIGKTIEKFKKCFRGRTEGKHLKKVNKEMKKLPTDLRNLLSEGKIKQFLEESLREFASNLKLSKCLLQICPNLGLSHEKEVHELVQRFYKNFDVQETKEVKKSRKAYIKKTERFELLPGDWLKKLWGKRIVEIRQSARDSDATSLAKLKKRLHDNHYVCDEAKLTFKVESEFRRKCQETPELQDGSLLLKAAKEFLSRIKIWLKLDGQFPKLPGVYFLYYIGDEELFSGIFVVGSRRVPVYVGMSKSDIGTRLADHRAKIDGAEDLQVADFAVKVMFVDNRYYAPCIEEMFIEDFNPVWNKETLGIGFGSGPNSMWKNFYVKKDPGVIDKMKLLNITGDQSGSQSESESSDD